jgi:hypothetical protein
LAQKQLEVGVQVFRLLVQQGLQALLDHKDCRVLPALRGLPELAVEHLMPPMILEVLAQDAP